MGIDFKHSPELTLGVELELQLLDKNTQDLTPAAPSILDLIGDDCPTIKPEVFQAMIEINTGICKTMTEVRRDLLANVTRLYHVCDELNVDLAATGSHPFARYRDRIVFPTDRYDTLIERNRWLARRLMIFGIHVHIGVRDGDHAMQMINGLLPYLPCLLAFSASSPFWQGNDTGLASSRITIFEALPTAGHPCTFASWKDFEDTIEAMYTSKSINSLKDIWWDIRPSPDFGTVEIRICDGMPTISETLALVALIQAIAHHVNQKISQGEPIPLVPYWIIRENKWRAAKDGMNASLVTGPSGTHMPMREYLAQLIRDLAPISDALGSSEDLKRAGAMLSSELSYERQLGVFAKANDFRAVAKALAQEFRSDWEMLSQGKKI